MKKIIALFCSLLIFSSLTGCFEPSESKKDLDDSSVSSIIEDSETNKNKKEQETTPEYNTLNISVEELVDKLNNSGNYTETWSASCTIEASEDGKTIFQTSDKIIGCYWHGAYETNTKNIIYINISYPCDSSDALNTALACATSEAVMEFVFNIDRDTAMEKWVASSTEGDQPIGNDYMIRVGYNSSNKSIDTFIYPVKELE